MGDSTTDKEEEAPATDAMSYPPIPPPFNPGESEGQGTFNSVVPDLMKVYESLTQSKTPQDAAFAHWSYDATAAPHTAISDPDLEDSSKREAEEETGSTRSAAKRRKKEPDGRWSKRFTWPEELHRDFVSAIFDVGLKHSSPATILEHMPPHEQINAERIKSHLQKYRLHRVKSKKEFMSSYEASLQGFKGTASLASGEVAGYLAHTALAGEDGATKPEAKRQPKAELLLPQLTVEEKQSPIGASMGYLMGLFFSLRQQLMAQREAKIPPAPLDVAAAAVEHPDDAKSAPRSQLEQSHMMKREMQSQMAVQNKMRMLKQKELQKYKLDDPMDQQGAGEIDHKVPMAAVDDFWNNEAVMDDQLFEFLMSEDGQ